jgi:lysophospholipid acyltransferase (LPLAT)-like uncharacterized protein
MRKTGIPAASTPKPRRFRETVAYTIRRRQTRRSEGFLSEQARNQRPAEAVAASGLTQKPAPLEAEARANVPQQDERQKNVPPNAQWQNVAPQDATDDKSDPQAVSTHYDTRLPDLPWSRRVQIPLIAAVVYSVIRTLGPTLRYEVLGWQHAERVYAAKKQCIWSFWHRVIIPVVWWARHRGIVVMNTTAFDGQWTRKVIEWLGFGTAQGSSSRGGLRGLAVMAKRLAEGLDCAFTIDGPRGPRYVAKPGPVMLARKTGCPVVVFHMGVDRGRTFEKTWDHFLLPMPFARTVMLVAPPIYVPEDADQATLEAKHAEMQRELERVRDIAEQWFALTEAQRQAHRTAFSR